MGSGVPLISQEPPGVRGGDEIAGGVFIDPVSQKKYLYLGNGYTNLIEKNSSRIVRFKKLFFI